jgi:hypothetical protein
VAHTSRGSEDEAMSDVEKEPAKRGEAAWLAAKEQVAKRNAEARKAGKQRREAYEREREAARQGAEKRRARELARARRTS